MIFLPLYIDPGTGSMLFSLLIGIATAGIFGLRALFSKLKFIFNGGKTDKNAAQGNIPYVIFSDHKRYWNVFKPICDEFERRNLSMVYYTCSADDPVFSAEYKNIKAEFIGERNKAFAKLNMVHADIFIATTPNLDVYQWKRSKFVKCYVHIPHSADELAGYRMFGLDYYDAVLTTGQNQIDLIRKIESLRPSITKKQIISVGSLTLDNLKARFDLTEKCSNEKPTILLAPSWGKSGILSKYGDTLLSVLEKSNFNVIVRPHPQTVVSEQSILKPLEEKYSSIEWNYDNDNFEVLNKTDLLITDFSGIIFDFACVFDKPLIYADTEFNTLPYDADWLDEPRWSFKILPQIGIQLKESDFGHLKSIIETALNDSRLKAGRSKIRKECWEHIGESAARAADFLIAKHEEVANT